MVVVLELHNSLEQLRDLFPVLLLVEEVGKGNRRVDVIGFLRQQSLELLPGLLFPAHLQVGVPKEIQVIGIVFPFLRGDDEVLQGALEVLLEKRLLALLEGDFRLALLGFLFAGLGLDRLSRGLRFLRPRRRLRLLCRWLAHAQDQPPGNQH